MGYLKTIFKFGSKIRSFKKQANKFMEEKNYKKAIEVYDQMIEEIPDYFDAYYYRAFAHLQNDNYDKGIIDYSKYIEFDPYDNVAYYNRGLAYFYIGNYDQAINDFTQVLELKPNEENGKNMLKEAIEHKKNMSEPKNEDNNNEIHNDKKISLENIALFAQKLLSDYGNQEYINMLYSKGFQFIDTNEVLKEYFFSEIKFRKLNKIEFAKIFQFCGFTYYCFKHFIWLEEKDISQLYTKEQLIKKINKLSYDSLYLKLGIVDPLLIISPEMNLDFLYLASKQPDLIKYISVNMTDKGMIQVIPDKQKIIDIIMINHIFINILAGDYE